MRMLINGKTWLTLALIFNAAVAALSFAFPRSQPGLPVAEPTQMAINASLPLPDASGDAALPDLVCRRWGPLGDPSAFATLMRRIEAAGGSVELLQTPLADQPDHLVLIGPAASPAATRRLRDELLSQSIPNHLISEALSSSRCSQPLSPQDQPNLGSDVSNCPEEALFAGALAVGVFAELNAAAAFEAELATLGYQVRVETLTGPRQAYYLRAQTPRDAPPFALPSTPCPSGSS